jgi:putative spermidine/putrescine transport system ATP-binding protein
MAFLDIKNLHKSYGTANVVQNVDLSIERGEFVSFLGPSGCGKTTTLRMVAGFETRPPGPIRINGQDVTEPAARTSAMSGWCSSPYALFPNMTVADNVGFGLKSRSGRPQTIAPRVEEMLRLIKLPQLGAALPYQLSGGQQQRVALARALADRAAGAVARRAALGARRQDPGLACGRNPRRSAQAGITTIYVTHDQEEALSMSDRIVVMNEGPIEQIGTPFEIYNFPRTRFVASFVGTLNILRARVLDPVNGRISVDGQELLASRAITDAPAGEIRSVALRPEAAVLQEGSGERNRLRGTIEEVSFLGSVVRVRVRFKESAVSLDTFNNPNAPPPERGQPVTVSFAREDLLVLEGADAA